MMRITHYASRITGVSCEARAEIRDLKSEISPRRGRDSAGFTLLELLVAMIIFSVIAGASWALLDSGRGVAAHASYEAARMQTVRAALRAIEADLRGAWAGAPPAANAVPSAFDTGLLGTNGGTPDRPLDTIALISFANQPALETPASGTVEREMDLARITWSVDEDQRTDPAGLVRDRKKRITELVTVVEPGVGLEEIAKDVVALDIRYYDGGGWVDSWDSTLSGTMPKAIEVTVQVRGEFRGRGEIESFTTRIYLPVAATVPRKTQ